MTVEEIRPTLEDWEELDDWARLHDPDAPERMASLHPAADIVPFSHFNNSGTTMDTLLAHIAISRTMDDIFDNPIRVTLADGTQDLRPGIEIARPMIPEASFLHLTDHLPVILTLRTTIVDVPVEPVAATLTIVGALPDPADTESQNEQVILRNPGTDAAPLAGWRIGDRTGTRFWHLDAQDGEVPPGGTVTATRRGRNMGLNNDGDDIVLFNPDDAAVSRKTYGDVETGQVVIFE